MITELTWKDIRKKILDLNPEFAAIIDELNPNSDYTFIKATYPYGTEILKKSQLQLSSNDKGIKEKLAYSLGSNPVAIVLNNAVELFIDLEDRIIPFAIVPAGKIFGTWKFLDIGVSFCPKTFIWGLTAGARSLFMLPKISKTTSHNKLVKRYNITSDTPRNLLDQWEIFKSLASSPDFGESWNVELLYFSGKWFEHRDDKAWINFYYYLLNNAWQGSGYWRNQFVWDLMFSIIEKKRGIKPPAYLSGIVKHLLAIGAGSVLGFSPAPDDSLAPIKKLQEIYINDYGLKEYAPIIMQPSYFTLYNGNHPVYYSLQLPTELEFATKSQARTTTLTDLYMLKSLFNKYLYEILNNDDLKIQETPLYDATVNANYDFLHSTTGNYRDIKKTDILSLEDASFMKNWPKKDFPDASNFLNGCVRVSHKS